MSIRRLTLREDRDTWKRFAIAMGDDPRRSLCGVVIHSSWHEPVACAFRPGHQGDHSWASIPCFDPRPASNQEDSP